MSLWPAAELLAANPYNVTHGTKYMRQRLHRFCAASSCHLICCLPAELLAANPYNVTHGTDFVRECASPHIDFASIHMYADQWCPGTGAEQCNRWDMSVTTVSNICFD